MIALSARTPRMFLSDALTLNLWNTRCQIISEPTINLNTYIFGYDS
jgi:hypothetical protein